LFAGLRLRQITNEALFRQAGPPLLSQQIQKTTMSETAEPRYYALISLKLADKTEKVTANVTVAPLDEIPTSSGSKPLAECTVADLQAYAAALEEEAWHTYHEITFLELSSGEDPALSLTLVDESGSSLPAEQDWREQVFLLPAKTGKPAQEVEEIPVTTAAAETTVDKAGETATRKPRWSTRNGASRTH
jgi:hypothetical protein